MKCSSISATIVLLLSCGASCNRVELTAKEEPVNAIERANAAFAAAFEKGDVKTVAQMYTETGQLFPPNAEVIEGHDAIEKFWKSVMADGVARLELKSAEVESCGDSLVESGRATLFGKEGIVLDRGKYIVLWKKVAGQWKLHRDCWNSSQPATGNATRD